MVMQEEKKGEEPRPDLEHGKLPDPQAKAIACLFDQIRALETKVQELTARLEESDRAAAEQAEKSSRSRQSV
jgi:serine O-acetyltransferase